MKHGKILEKLYKGYDITGQDMAGLLGKTPATFYNLLKKESFDKATIALLCTLFKEVTPQTFGKGC